MTVRVTAARLIATTERLIILRGSPTIKPHLQFTGGRWFVSGPMTHALFNWIQEREQS